VQSWSIGQLTRSRSPPPAPRYLVARPVQSSPVPALSPPRPALRPLLAMLDRGGLSTRGLDRVMRVAWTLSDLAGRSEPGVEQVAEAYALRTGYGLTTLSMPA